jgi:IclR family transcriptional regulator, acetate operon repressor
VDDETTTGDVVSVTEDHVDDTTSDVTERTDSDESASGASRSLDRPFLILAALHEHRAPMRLSQISSAAQLHLATTQRLLNLLVRHGYVEREGVEYRLGIRSLLNGNSYLLTNRLTQIAEPVLHELTTSTGLTSTLSVRFDLTQVLLLRVASTPPLRYQLPVGEQTSLVIGPARVLAAALTTEELDRLLEGVENFPLASGVVLDRDEFVGSLRSIRSRGYALGQGQHEAGTISVAVPVIDHQGDVVAAIQASAMIEDISVDIDALVLELKRASAAISRRMT